MFSCLEIRRRSRGSTTVFIRFCGSCRRFDCQTQLELDSAETSDVEGWLPRLYYPVGSVETAGCSPNETAGSSTDQSAFYKQANGSAVCLIADIVEGSCKGWWRFLMSSYPWTPGGTANGLDEWTYGFHFIIMRSQEVPSGFSGGYRMNYTLLLLNTMEFIG